MSADYDNFAESFSASRKNMVWPEVDYFLGELTGSESILDIGCGSGRLLKQYKYTFGKLPEKYLGTDASEKMIAAATNQFPESMFLTLDMRELNPDVLGNIKTFESVFAIASFHHLENMADRHITLEKIYNLLSHGGRVYMTHWALESSVNQQKYAQSKIPNSENEFGSSDFAIKIGKFERFYHSFTLDELNFLAKQAGFDIIQGIIFPGEKNIITVWEKQGKKATKNI